MHKSLRNLAVVLATAVVLTACQRPAEPAATAEPTAPTAPATPAPTPTASPGGEVCGGIAGVQCKNATDFCKMATGQCQVADAQGVCTKKPEECTKEYVPVCGCDEKTYGNACEADRAGVSVVRPGACEKKG